MDTMANVLVYVTTAIAAHVYS